MRLASSTLGLLRLLLMLGSATAASQADTVGQPISLLVAVPLNGVEGRLDHLAVDVASHKLFVAALENHSVEIVDLAKHRHVHRLTAINEPQGLLFLPGQNRLFVCCRGDGTCRTFDDHTYAEGPWSDLGRNADNIRFDPVNRMVLVGSGGEPGNGALTAVPLASLLPSTDGGQPSPPHSPADFLLNRPRQADSSMEIQLPSHPESFQLDQSNGRIFVNVPDEHEIAVLTVGTNFSIAAKWPVTAGDKNFPMTLDAADARLFIATRNPPRLVAYDTATGHALSQTPCVGDADDLFYDATLRRLYVIGGEGFVDVFQLSQGDDNLQRLAHISTAPRARTGLYIPELSLLTVASPHTTNSLARILLFRINS